MIQWNLYNKGISLLWAHGGTTEQLLLWMHVSYKGTFQFSAVSTIFQSVLFNWTFLRWAHRANNSISHCSFLIDTHYCSVKNTWCQRVLFIISCNGRMNTNLITKQMRIKVSNENYTTNQVKRSMKQFFRGLWYRGQKIFCSRDPWFRKSSRRNWSFVGLSLLITMQDLYCILFYWIASHT